MTRALMGAGAALFLITALATPVAAHAGHAGDHGWLFGALQPFLSFDHLLAGIFVVGVGALAFALLGRWTRSSERRTS